MTRRLLAALVLTAALLTVVAAPAQSQPSVTPRCSAVAHLSPSNEVRVPPAPVDSQAFGIAVVRIEGTTLDFDVTIVNLARETFVAGHIHNAVAGVNGPIVVHLFDGPPTDPIVFVQHDSVEISAEAAAAICGNLAGYYVNYHTTVEQAGATRGQLG